MMTKYKTSWLMITANPAVYDYKFFTVTLITDVCQSTETKHARITVLQFLLTVFQLRKLCYERPVYNAIPKTIKQRFFLKKWQAGLFGINNSEQINNKKHLKLLQNMH